MVFKHNEYTHSLCLSAVVGMLKKKSVLSPIVLPQEYLLEAPPFLTPEICTVSFTTASTSTHEWSPIQVLTVAQVAELQLSYVNGYFQIGKAVTYAIHF